MACVTKAQRRLVVKVLRQELDHVRFQLRKQEHKRQLLDREIDRITKIMAARSGKDD